MPLDSQSSCHGLCTTQRTCRSVRFRAPLAGGSAGPHLRLLGFSTLLAFEKLRRSGRRPVAEYEAANSVKLLAQGRRFAQNLQIAPCSDLWPFRKWPPGCPRARNDRNLSCLSAPTEGRKYSQGCGLLRASLINFSGATMSIRPFSDRPSPFCPFWGHQNGPQPESKAQIASQTARPINKPAVAPREERDALIDSENNFTLLERSKMLSGGAEATRARGSV